MFKAHLTGFGHLAVFGINSLPQNPNFGFFPRFLALLWNVAVAMATRTLLCPLDSLFLCIDINSMSLWFVTTPLLTIACFKTPM